MRARTGGLSFPKGGTVVFQPGGKLLELTGLIVENAIIPAEQEVTLMISNPGMSPIRLQEGLNLGEAQPVDWLRDFTKTEDTPSMENLEGRSQPEEFIEHQDIVCGVVEGDGSKDLTGRQESLVRQFSDDGPQSIDGDAREQLKELVLAFEDTFAMDENELGCAQDVAYTIDTGDHQPIRQPTRRVRIALRGK